MGNNKKKKQLFEDEEILRIGLPQANLSLILGVLSILSCFVFGIIGLTLGIIARNISNKSIELYQLAPELYTRDSYKNIKAGRTCALIGIILSLIFLVVLVIFTSIRGVFETVF